MYTKQKKGKELDFMRESCRIAAEILQTMLDAAEPGMTGLDINRLAVAECKKYGVKPAFYGYDGFPAAVCMSVNDEIVHGIPSAYVLKKGDLLSLDFGVTYRGMISDTAKTIIVGDDGSKDSDIDNIEQKRRLLAGTQESLMAGIKAIKAGAHTGDVGAAAQAVMERYGLGIVRDLVGHGVGHDVHEEPNIPNFGKAGTGHEFKAGMTVAIEPMATLGTHNIELDKRDGWTIRTADGSLSAHFEHTVLVTESGYEILTLAK